VNRYKMGTLSPHLFNWFYVGGGNFKVNVFEDDRLDGALWFSNSYSVELVGEKNTKRQTYLLNIT